MPSFSNHFGWIKDEAEVDRILCSLSQPLFSSAASHLLGTGDGKVALLYEAVRKVWGKDHDPGPQLLGDCVSWGYSGCVDTLACLEIVGGQQEEHSWDLRTCTEALYALSRVEYGELDGSYEDGSVGAWAAAAVTKGGTLSRKRLGGYDPKRAKEWGAKGLPNDLEKEAREHLVKTASLVRSWDELKAALANGYPVAVCSNQGFSLQRDAKGRCRPEGTWMHCAHPDEVINGPVPFFAREMKEGYDVFCHDGTLGKIKEVYSRQFSGELVVIKCAGLPPIKVTPDHQLLVKRKVKKLVTLRSFGLPPQSFLFGEEEPKWVCAKDIREGDCLLTPPVPVIEETIPSWESSPGKAQNIPRPLRRDPEIAWLFGLYIADGSASENHCVSICLGGKETDIAERAKRVFQKMGLEAYIKNYGTYLRVNVYSAILANSFRKWFGTKCHEKVIPSFLYSGWDLRELVEGILDGDGCTYKNRRIISTVSKRLMYQLHQILVTLGENVMINKAARGKGSYPNGRYGWTINWTAEKKKKGWNSFEEETYFLKVREVSREVYEGPVYDCLVPGQHSFLLSGIVSSNCMKFLGYRDDGWSAALCCNSHGADSPSGPKGDFDIPSNSWWVDAATVNYMLRQGDSFALSSFNGYPRRDVTLEWIFR